MMLLLIFNEAHAVQGQRGTADVRREKRKGYIPLNAYLKYTPNLNKIKGSDKKIKKSWQFFYK